MDMEKLKAILDVLNAAAKAEPATKAAGGDKEDEKEETHKAAYGKAAELAHKAHKAVGAMHEHISGIEHEDAKGIKEDSAKVHKAMKALHGDVHKAAGVEAKEDEKEETKEAAAYGEAMKSLGALTAKIEMLEKAAYQPKSAGAGAGFVAQKGAGLQTVGAKVGEMTEDERTVARKAALAQTRQLPISADKFQSMSYEALKAAEAVVKLAGDSGDIR